MTIPHITRRTADLSRCEFSPAVPPLLQRIYAARGAENDRALMRTLQELPGPEGLLSIDEAVSLLEQTISEQQAVLIIGDFDADGATSTALTLLALSAMGFSRVSYIVPNRFEYGYGLTPEIVELAKQQSPDLIITVDNGISSVSGVKAAKDAGIKVLITDHHLPGAQLPEADAIVNPNQHGCEFPGKNLAGVGVVFYLMSALRKRLRERGWFAEQQRVEPNMAEWLDLVALGTVADVVTLDTINRILVYQGLQRIRAGKSRPGIQALLDLAGRDASRLVASDLGFAIGPRLNAAGRLDDMSIGIQCLLETDPYLAREYALQLDELNRDRRVIEADMQREALVALEQLHLDEQQLPWGLCLFDANWHQGVVGLLASRIKDRVHRPVIVFADADNGEYKGSARSIKGLHIRDVLDAVASRHPGLISKFGGHAMAAGLSLAKDHYPTFVDAFDAEVRRLLTPADMEAEILTDGVLNPDQLSIDTAQLLREAGPWGQHFPEPLFEGEFHVVQQRIVGEKHLKLVLTTDASKNQLIDAIAFNVDTERWPNPAVDKVQIVYKLDINLWRGRESVQLLVEHLANVI
ncbi:single-stranded-DNA-specific exonuclease RecJ [Porticoccus sp.]|uniref:single-stranded-DNA-specific exonuclease RecJ n=1 Tax=Porticoccus sp. TaxID=2024853 RepID=UPI003F69AFEB